MYVLQWIIDTFKKGTQKIASCCQRTNLNGEGDRLIEEDGRGTYASMDVATPTSDGLGLTAEYKNWFETNSALHHALSHFLGYVVVAVIGFSFVFEKWPIVDSVYFAIVVFTTVGYGDLSPTNDVSRVFVIFFALYGIIILGIFLGIVGGYILECHDEAMKERMGNARVKVLEQFEPEDTSRPPPKRNFAKDLLHICYAEAPIIIILALIGIPIIWIEGWDPIMGVYWMVVTGTTIGFGDLGPTEALTRCVCVLWIPLAVAVLGEFLGRVAQTYIDRRNDELEDKFLERAMTVADLERMDTDDNNKVTPDEFLRYMLIALQKVEAEEIDEILALFRKLDKSKTGAIEKHDLMNNFNLNVRPGVTLTAASLRPSS